MRRIEDVIFYGEGWRNISCSGFEQSELKERTRIFGFPILRIELMRAVFEVSPKEPAVGAWRRIESGSAAPE